MRFSFTFLMLFGLMIVASPAQAADHVFTPKGKWIVDYGVDQCRVAREFESGDKTIILVFLRSESRDGMRVQIVGDMPKIREQNGNVTVRFLPNGDENSGFYYAGTAANKKSLVITGSDAFMMKPTEERAENFILLGGRLRLAPENRASFTGVSLTIRRLGTITFETGSLSPVLKVLEDCTDTLAVHWGFDDATEKSLSQRPEASNDSSSWIQPMDYPAFPLNYGGVASIDFRLNVEADGRVTDCFILNQAGEDVFANLVCKKLMQRAKLSPALDKDGKPVRSFYINRVNFIIKPW